MAAIRVLIVDDSVVIRKLLSETLAEDRGLEVVGTASDGRLGLAKIAQLHPDLVTLDVEMPVMNWAGGACRAAQVISQAAGCDVQHSNRAWRSGDAGCFSPGRFRLRHQAE